MPSAVPIEVDVAVQAAVCESACFERESAPLNTRSIEDVAEPQKQWLEDCSASQKDVLDIMKGKNRKHIAVIRKSGRDHGVRTWTKDVELSYLLCKILRHLLEQREIAKDFERYVQVRDLIVGMT